MVTFMRWFIPKYGLVIEIDSDGHILSSLHDPTGGVYETSEVNHPDLFNSFSDCRYRNASLHYPRSIQQLYSQVG